MCHGRVKALRRELRRLIWNAAAPVGEKAMDKAWRRVYLLHRHLHLSALERQQIFYEMYPVVAGVRTKTKTKTRFW